MTLLYEAVVVLILILAGALLTGFLGLPLIRRLQLGQRVRDDGPKTHYVKTGTPTFGGFFFLIPLSLLAVFLPLVKAERTPVSMVVALMLLFALVGFLDDFVKVRKNPEGFSVKQKSVLLALFSVLFTVWYLWFSAHEPFFLLPFSRQMIYISGFWKVPYAVFVILFLFFTSNAVNISDGLDGLSSTLTIICCLAYAVIGIAGAAVLPLGSSGAVAATALMGGCLGFLYFNRHPAKIFMGDTGSQALGAGVAGISLLYGAPWLVLLAGVVYVIDALSTLAQVLYFRKTGGKRLFRMAPLHHHFELGGWSEQKVVRLFALAGLIGALLAVLTVVPWLIKG